MKREKVRAFALALAVTALDQITKALALRSLTEVPVPVIGDVVRLVLRFNTGAAFSVSWGGPSVLRVVQLVGCVFLGYLMLRM